MRLSSKITSFYMSWVKMELAKSDLAYMSYQPQFVPANPTMEDIDLLESKLVSYFKRHGYKASRSSEGYDVMVWRKK